MTNTHSRTAALLDHELSAAAETLLRLGSPVKKLDATRDVTLTPEWTAFVDALYASAVIATALGETPDEWSLRSNRRWGTPNAVAKVRENLETGGVSHRGTREWASGLVASAADSLSRDERTDIPSQVPQVAVGAWAGISGVDLVLDLRETSARVTAASIDVSVLLGMDERGAHMSRMQQSITASEEIEFTSPLDAAHWVAQNSRDRQRARSGRAEVRCRLKQRRKARHSNEESSIGVSVIAQVEAPRDASSTATMRVQVDVMTACPCTLRFSQLKAERATGISAERFPPTFTHSQPGTLAVTVSGALDELPTWDLIVESLDGVAHLREAVLKREDEHELVERAHRRPQFTEDLTRAAVLAIAARVPGEVHVRAEAELSESIHPHRASSSAEALAADLWMN